MLSTGGSSAATGEPLVSAFGGTDLYGAPLPEAVLARADQLAEQLSQADITEAIESVTGKSTRKAKAVHYDEVDLTQMSLFDTVSDQDVIRELGELDVQNLTPIDALNELYRLQNRLKNRWKNG